MRRAVLLLVVHLVAAGVPAPARAAGETSALIYIQVQNGSVGSEANNGLRFWSDEGDSGNSAPELDMQTIPEPATLGLIAVMGGAILFIRRRFMI